MKLLPRGDLKAWVDSLASEVTLVAPSTVDGVLLYGPVSSSREVFLDYSRPNMSAKEFVLPSTERILSIEKREGELTLSEPIPRDQVIFGLRPCDAHGIAVLDTVFMEKDPVDFSYARRRTATTLIGMSCPQMWEDCFCTSVGGAPNDSKHMDLMLTEVKDGYVVELITTKGKDLIAELELQDFEGELPGAVLNPPEPVLSSEHWARRFDDHYWDLVAERCIECRVCAYLCPACRCFDVRDQLREQGISYSKHDRLRCWDSCTGPNYRVIAGGHNPRMAKGERLRNRFFCKFKYLSEMSGQGGCVGCGRCIESCPVNIDIVEVLRDVSLASTVELNSGTA